MFTARSSTAPTDPPLQNSWALPLQPEPNPAIGWIATLPALTEDLPALTKSSASTFSRVGFAPPALAPAWLAMAAPPAAELAPALLATAAPLLAPELAPALAAACAAGEGGVPPFACLESAAAAVSVVLPDRI